MSITERLRLRRKRIIEDRQKSEAMPAETDFASLVKKNMERVVFSADNANSRPTAASLKGTRRGEDLEGLLSANMVVLEKISPQTPEAVQKERDYNHAVGVLQKFAEENIGGSDHPTEDRVIEIAKNLDTVITQRGTLRKKQIFSPTIKRGQGQRMRIAKYPVVEDFRGEQAFHATTVDAAVSLTYFDKPGDQPNFSVHVPLDEHAIDSAMVSVRYGKKSEEYSFLKDPKKEFAAVLQTGVKIFLSVLTEPKIDMPHQSKTLQPASV